MKITLLTLGTRGDFEPFLALAIELKNRGHCVTLGGPDNFQDLATQFDVPFEPIGVDIQRFMQSDDVKAVISGNWFKLRQIWHSMIKPMFKKTLARTWEISRNAEVIVYHPKVYGAVDVAERTGAKLYLASLIPMIPTSTFPVPIFKHSLGKVLNYLSYKMFDFSRLPYRDIIDHWRINELSLEKNAAIRPIDRCSTGKITTLCAFSSKVVPKPEDWGEHVRLTGYWRIKQNQPLDTRVQSFIRKGTPPIYFGFGSATFEEASSTTYIIVEAVKRMGIRAIIATGWNTISQGLDNDSILTVEGAPHDTLFPQMAAIVHHGGAGTTSAALIAGKPSFLTPIGVDQPFWANVIYRLGCGPKPISLKKLTTDKLVQSLEQLLYNPEYLANARVQSRYLEQENGPAKASDIIEKKH